MPTKACKECGAGFKSHAANKTHCSVECRLKSEARAFRDSDACWEWPKSRNVKSGYGQLSEHVGGKHKLHTAHVVSYRAFSGPTSGLFVCHHCDNPPCFNPRHLFLGTVKDNAQDAKKKGRLQNKSKAMGDSHWTRKHPELVQRGESHHSQRNPGAMPRGSMNHKAKITELDVIYIRSSSETLEALGRRFGLSASAICQIKKRHTWKHV